MGLESRPTDELQFVKAFLGNTRGIIPSPVDASRIDKQTYANGSETRVLYTVPTGKVLFISSSWCWARVSADASCETQLQLRDTDDSILTYLLALRFDKAGQGGLSNQYHPAIQLSALQDVALASDHANMDARAGFSGWLEDA